MGFAGFRQGGVDEGAFGVVECDAVRSVCDGLVKAG